MDIEREESGREIITIDLLRDKSNEIIIHK